MEAKNAELQKEVEGIMDKLNRDRLHPFSKAMYMRMSECYNNKSASANDIERCLTNASAPAQHAQSIIQNEFGGFQKRLERCMMDCRDEVMDKFPNIDANNQAAAQSMYEKGSIKCMDKHLALMKSLHSNIEQKLDEVLKK